MIKKIARLSEIFSHLNFSICLKEGMNKRTTFSFLRSSNLLIETNFFEIYSLPEFTVFLLAHLSNKQKSVKPLRVLKKENHKASSSFKKKLHPHSSSYRKNEKSEEKNSESEILIYHSTVKVIREKMLSFKRTRFLHSFYDSSMIKITTLT